jgi:hypothetical protein
VIKKFPILKAILLASLSLSAASASTLTVIAADYSRGEAITIRYNRSLESVFAGAINIAVDGVRQSAVCVDLDHTIGEETILVNPTSPTSVSNGLRIAWLVVNKLPAVVDPSFGAALQLAIWDILYDGGDGMTAGAVQLASLSDPLAPMAQSYVASSVGKSSSAAYAFKAASINPDRQTLMSAANYDSAPVPEPSEYALVGSGLIGLSCLARKRIARKS